jgi:hypothetical protein
MIVVLRVVYSFTYWLLLCYRSIMLSSQGEFLSRLRYCTVERFEFYFLLIIYCTGTFFWRMLIHSYSTTKKARKNTKIKISRPSIYKAPTVSTLPFPNHHNKTKQNKTKHSSKEVQRLLQLRRSSTMCVHCTLQ